MRRKTKVIIAIGVLLLLLGGIGLYLVDRHKMKSNESEPGTTEVVTPEEEDKPAPIKKPKPKPETETNELETVTEDPLSGIETEHPDSLTIEEVVEETEMISSHSVLIPRSKCLCGSHDISTNQLPPNKLYYSLGKAKIESMVLKNDKNELLEYLISYDSYGNKVDNMEIGLISVDGEVLKYAIISQNKIATYTLSKDKNNQPEEMVTEYTITPTLHFIKGKTYTKIL